MKSCALTYPVFKVGLFSKLRKVQVFNKFLKQTTDFDDHESRTACCYAKSVYTHITTLCCQLSLSKHSTSVCGYRECVCVCVHLHTQLFSDTSNIALVGTHLESVYAACSTVRLPYIIIIT